MNNIKLRDYQISATEAAIFTTDLGENALLSLCTGSGKSLIIAEIIRKLKNKNNIIRCLMLVPSTTLLQQNLEKINMVAPDLEVGVYAAGLKKKELDKDIIYATIQSYNNVADENLSWFDSILIDECFDGDVEVLTDKGFKKFKELDKTELIAQYENGKIDFVKPLNYIKRFHDGKMIKLKTHRDSSIIMTPNHNQLYLNKDNEEAIKPIKDVPLRYENKFIVSQNKNDSNDKLSPFERALIAIQADGCAVKQDNFSKYQIQLTRPEKIERWLQITQQAGLKINEVKACKIKARRWTFSLKDYEEKKAKHLYKCFNLKDFSYSKARDFINELCYWDGSFDEKTKKPRQYLSKIKDNTDFVSSVAFLGGYHIYQKIVVDNRKENFSDMHRIFFLDTNIKSCQSMNKEYIDYNDYVYCVEVPSHKIIVKSRGFTFVTGNCHMISDKGAGMYHDVINRLKTLNPKIRIVGLTGTAFRTSSGMITEGEHALFKDICFEYTTEQGINDGFLCPLTSKISKQEIDLSNIHIKQGDYDERELDMLMSNQEKVDLTVRESLEFGRDRHSFLWFCTGVNHVSMIQAKLIELGEKSAVITGDTPQKEREQIIRDFKDRVLRHIISANAIYTGFDAPLTDCLVALRPTKSPGLFIQLCGRGLRLDKSKENCLFLDFGNLIQEHGSILDIKIKKKFNIETKKVENVVVKVLENTKMCPECRTVLKKTDLQCPICGYLYSKEEILNHNIKPSELDIMAKRTNYDIIEVNSYDIVPWIAKSGNMCIKEVFVTDFGNIMSFHAVNNYYTNKWLKEAINREDRDFVDIMDCEFDNNFDMFMSRFGQFNDIDSFTEFLNGIKPFFKTPTRIKAEKDGRYYKVIEIDYDTSIEKPEDNDFIV